MGCKDDANGNVPLGRSCNRYWACQGGYPRLQRCPAMLVFDKTRKRCVAPPTEVCDVPPTTTPEEVEEEDRPNNIPENRRRDQFSASNRQNMPFQLPDSPISSRQPILE